MYQPRGKSICAQCAEQVETETDQRWAHRRRVGNKLAIDAKSNPKAVWKYMNSKTKTRECVSDLNINPHDDKSRLTNSDK